MKTSIFVHPYYFSSQKRWFDLFFVICSLPISVLLGIVIGTTLLIKNGRPILFWQQRFGQHKKPFWMVKFRTMRHDAEAEESRLQPFNESTYPAFKIKRDPRFVQLGQWLSETGLDELPQIWNILKNEMSLIGPRPLPIHQAKKLPSSFQFRHKVKPGIISLWALSKNRHQSLRDWSELEAQTVRTGGWGSDLRLIQKTAQMLFKNARQLIKKIK